MSRREVKPLSKKEIEKLKKSFKAELKLVKKGGKKVNQLTPVTKILCDIPEEHHEATICQIIEKKEDGLEYTLKGKCYRLFLVLLNKINARMYLSNSDLLQKAIESQDDTAVDVVLQGYERSDVNIIIAALPEKTKRILYEGSWSKDVVERLYPHTSSYFISRGQKKAKMIAILCYNKFEQETSNQSPRDGAEEEAGYMTRGLRDCGFTVRTPLVDWTFEELLQAVGQLIDSVKDKCSVLVLCLMSHGEKGILFDKNGDKGEINEVLKQLNKLKSHIPVIAFLQSCQGDREPQQGVNMSYRYRDGSTRDALPPNSSESGENETRAVVLYNLHISIDRANTLVVTATAESYYATRKYFFKYMARQLEQSDGITTINSMVQLCSKAMSMHMDGDCRRQAPLTYDLLRQPLILPRAAADDWKQIQDTGQSKGKVEELRRLGYGFRKLLGGKIKDAFHLNR